ncbi:MAG: UbiA family prenyltransferase, partial [Deltaproteobacteria bacterium]|nr:UbiA family prenyltransferase [Deltaproteobacteria bacterium]
MLSTIKNYLPLFKFRICSFITFSAVVGLISTSPINISASHILALIVVTMMASAGASMFNHYFDMDIDGVMQRTKKRPMPSDRIGDSKVILLTAVGIFIISILLSYKILNYMAGLHLFLGGFVYAVVYTIWLKRRSW